MKKIYAGLAALWCALLVLGVPTLVMANDGSEEGIPWVGIVIFALVIGFLVAGISTLVLKSQLKSVHPNNLASDYITPGSFKVTHAHELFLYSKVDAVRKPPKDDKS